MWLGCFVSFVLQRIPSVLKINKSENEKEELAFVMHVKQISTRKTRLSVQDLLQYLVHVLKY